MTTTEWVTIPDFPLYQVCRDGGVRRDPAHPSHLPRDRLAACPNGKGYLIVVLMRNKKAHPRTAHGLVCAAFHGPKPTPRHEVGFRDDNRGNVHADNLFWRTRFEEHVHRHEKGTHVEGERVRWSILRAEEIPTIRGRLAAGDLCSAIARDFGVSDGAINGIRIGRNWKHVP